MSATGPNDRLVINKALLLKMIHLLAGPPGKCRVLDERVKKTSSLSICSLHYFVLLGITIIIADIWQNEKNFKLSFGENQRPRYAHPAGAASQNCVSLIKQRRF